MKTLTVTNARANLYALLDDVNSSHTPIQIIGKRGNAVLISEDDWRSIEETLYLRSIPGLYESICESLNEPIEDGTRLEEVNFDEL